jgi:DNA (cytosine-5)-methyltransferase 1
MSGNNQPWICSLEPGIAAREGGHVYEGVSGTLRANAGDNQMSVAYALDQQGGKGGANYAEEVMPTLCSDSHGTPHAVAYSFDSLASNSMKSSNPHSGCRQVEVAKTLDTTDPNPCKNQGGIAIVCKSWDARGNGDGEVVSTLTGDHNNRITGYSSVVVEPAPVYCLQGNGIDRADTAGCNGKGVKEDICYTLNTIDRPAVAYSMKTIARNGKVLTEQANPICASDYKDPDIVAYLASGRKTCGTLMANAGTKLWLGNQEAFSGDYHIIEGTAARYIVRRLTPTECARLQGFPDTWGHINPKEDFTDEEYSFWLEARNTHAAINGKTTKEYTKEQMLIWYSKLHTDSAEYKMWGNGIALPTALYCMQGISEVLHKEGE